jgi:isoquinoline 1-oxidoreductase beta subunit
MTTLSRRGFLVTGSATGFLVGVNLPASAAPPSVSTSGFTPNAVVHVGENGQVTLTMPYVEMGQGTYTSIAMLVAEELEIPLNRVRPEHAPPDEKTYGNPLLAGVQATGGSTSIMAAWKPLREAGAVARALLIKAAADQWKVAPDSCHAEAGEVVHPASNRRASYGALAAAAARLPVPKDVPLKDPKAFKLIGTPAKRLDTGAKVNGTAVFGIDARPLGVKVATLAQSPVFGGRVKRVDDRAARAVKGVRQIVRLDDAVAVVADHMGAALKGMDALEIEWDDGVHGQVSNAQVVRELEQATLVAGPAAEQIGDAAVALASAPTKIDAVYQVPFLAHATMEPMNCTVHVRPDGCDVWVGTQVAARARAAAAKVTGLPLQKVVLHQHLIGGGFGRRLEVDGVTRATEIAMKVAGPVKVVWTREEDIRHDMYRPYWLDRISAGLDDRGRPVAWSHRFAGSSVIARWLPPGFANGLDPDSIDGAVKLAYDLPNKRVEFLQVEPPGIPTAFWRSVGPSHNVFVVESFMDELAAAARQDPVAYRLALLEKAPRAKAVLALAAQKAAWGEILPAGAGRGVSLQSVFGSYLALVAEIVVAADKSVRVRRVVAAVDCGMVVNPNTVRAQIESGVNFGITAALYGEITVKDGRVEQSNFDDYQMLRIDEAPSIEVHIMPSSEVPGGMGEPGTSAIVPAVANAVFAATGRRLRKMPIDLART